MAEADVIVANEQLKKAQEEAKKADEAPLDTPKTETVSQTLTTTQWLSVISIGISLVGIYYKRQEIKNAFSKIKATAQLKRQTHKRPPHQLTHRLLPHQSHRRLPHSHRRLPLLLNLQKRKASVRWLKFLFHLNLYSI